MHGIILSELKRFVEARHGAPTWPLLLERAGAANARYLANETYPDRDVAAIVEAVSAMTGVEEQAVLEDFGEFIAPDLLDVYSALIRPEWRTLDVILNTERTVHTVVRMRSQGAAPPELKCVRTGPDEVILTYDSPRRMCGVAKGIGRGLGKYFHEDIAIAESACMHKGAPACVISFRRLA
ncbi:MAG TPA: heme NO-binding domain-containing protein [Candidatus Eisenbacteria bacterium]|nr:heme NO-binding domain-containing protein [Candidatus Eisenbacteria bacterium]